MEGGYIHHGGRWMIEAMKRMLLMPMTDEGGIGGRSLNW